MRCIDLIWHLVSSYTTSSADVRGITLKVRTCLAPLSAVLRGKVDKESRSLFMACCYCFLGRVRDVFQALLTVPGTAHVPSPVAVPVGVALARHLPRSTMSMKVVFLPSSYRSQKNQWRRQKQKPLQANPPLVETQNNSKSYAALIFLLENY